MSSAQKRIYLVCRMDEGGISYNMPSSIRLRGEVRVEGLRAALQAMIDRHEALRTAFLLVNGEPMQQILPHAEADFTYLVDEDSTEEALTAAFVQPFDLSKAPLIRMRLVKRRNDWLLQIDTHHIVSDGMSEEFFTDCRKR